MKALCWHGTNDIRCDTRPRPEDRGCARRHHQGDELRDLRLGPASDGRPDADHEERRRARPRVHGRGGRGRARASPSSRRATGSSCPSTSIAANAGSASWATIRCCQRSNRNAEMAAEQFGYTTAGLFGYSHLTGGYCGRPGRICARADGRRRAHEGAGRHERRGGAVPHRHLPDRLPGRRAGRDQGRRDRRDLGRRARSAISPSSRPRCWAPSASSRSRPCRSASRWPRRPAPPTSSTSRRRTCSSGSRRSARARAPTW